MTYKVELVHTEEGYSVACPELPGCYSEGNTEDEAIDNIKSAISEYLSVVNDMKSEEILEKKILFVEVSGSSPLTGPTPLIAPFKVKPFPIDVPHFTKVEDLLDLLEGPERR